jgi:hypothetical protein
MEFSERTGAERSCSGSLARRRVASVPFTQRFPKRRRPTLGARHRLGQGAANTASERNVGRGLINRDHQKRGLEYWRKSCAGASSKFMALLLVDTVAEVAQLAMVGLIQQPADYDYVA